MNAEIRTNEGEVRGGFPVVQHWQLIIDGEFIADTSAPHRARQFQEIADVINAAAPTGGK